MQVSVESLGALERRITVTVPAELFEQAFEKRIANIAKQAKIDGFRPGKAPLHHVKQRYGTTAKEEALGEIIQSSLQNAIVQQNMRPAGPPTVEPKPIVAGQPLEFVAIFEEYPNLDGVSVELNRIEKEIATVTEADVDYALEEIRKQQANWVPVGRAAQNNDRVVIDFKGSIDGVAFAGGEAHDFPVVLGSKRMIPGFEDGIVGMTVGEEKNIPVTFPENYHAKDLAGKAAEFAIKVISISEPKLPELDAAFLKKLGVKEESVEALRQEIRKNLERELDRVIKAKIKNQVFMHVYDRNPIEVPKALIEREANRLHDELHHHHDHHDHSEAEMNGFREAGRKNVALALLVGALIRKLGVTVDDAKIQDRLASIASSYEDPAAVIQWYNSTPRALEEVQMQLVEDLLVDKLLESAEVVEKTLTYRELTMPQASAA